VAVSVLALTAVALTFALPGRRSGGPVVKGRANSTPSSNGTASDDLCGMAESVSVHAVARTTTWEDDPGAFKGRHSACSSPADPCAAGPESWNNSLLRSSRVPTCCAVARPGRPRTRPNHRTAHGRCALFVIHVQEEGIDVQDEEATSHDAL
jgi:hypothetical protein